MSQALSLSESSYKKQMPFVIKKHFSKCVCVIDCFELFCERPGDLIIMARAQTFSHYKVLYRKYQKVGVEECQTSI